MTTGQDTMFEQVDEVLDKLRPFLLRDGGDCELVDVEDGIVKLRLLGCLRLIIAQFVHPEYTAFQHAGNTACDRPFLEVGEPFLGAE